MPMETVSIGLTIFLMVVALFISIIPYLPGPAIMWAIGVIFAALNNFERVPLGAVILMTIFMAIGSTSEFWLRYLGMAQRGGSCLGVIGSLIGGLLGTIFIPIPILGTLIGAVAGALVVEFLRVGELKHAILAGRSVFEMYLVNIVVEFVISTGIFITFLVSLWLTA